MKILSPLLAIALAGCSVVGIRSGTEEPRYNLVATLGDIEIRTYAPRLAANVTVPGDEIAARSAGFRRIAAYIFGANQSSTSISMTAPVAQAAASDKIAMTVPVAQAKSGPGGWTITFFMPSKYTAATLPKPNDPGIIITEVPAQTYAVYRYSGVPGRDAVTAAHAALFTALANTSWVATGDATDWFYDPPWTLPFARRNEVAVPVTPKSP
ncbi:MAG TPA: heme-binding protein [Acidocella sp.]|nr:heme-binding protein [Acidocella sp.]HQU05518.1 heme-binding protein [Acidocella sp.]